MYVIIEDGKVVTINVDNEIFEMAIESPEDIVFGDTLLTDGTFKKTGTRLPLIKLTNEQKRKINYSRKS